MLVHNHPSGDTTPSAEDIHVTQRIHMAGEMMGIQFLDHIIIGGDTYCSMRDQYSKLFEQKQ